MEKIEMKNDAELEKVAGGRGDAEGWCTVSGLHKGFLALRTKPGYDYNNEIKGSESEGQRNCRAMRPGSSFVCPEASDRSAQRRE